MKEHYIKRDLGLLECFQIEGKYFWLNNTYIPFLQNAILEKSESLYKESLTENILH